MYKYYAMGLEKIYSALAAKNVDEGIAFLVTDENHLIEVHLYGNIIINLKSRHMPIDQLAGQLASLPLKDANITATAVRLAQAQPGVIRTTFPQAAALALSRESWSPARRVRTVKLLAALQSADAGSGTDAAALIAAEIIKRYPEFSLHRSRIEKRIANFTEEFRFPLPFLVPDSIPDDPLEAAVWLVTACKSIPPLLETVLVLYLIFGETLHKVYQGNARRENTLDTKDGCIRISCILYREAAAAGLVSLLRGTELVGVFQVTPLDDRRLDILLSEADASRASLRDGDPLHLIFAK